MKRILLLIFLGLCLKISAQEFNYQGIYYEVLDQEAKTCTTRTGGWLKTGNSIGGDIVLPAHPVFNNEEYTLVEIGDFSFQHSVATQDYIKSVTFPVTLTRIGKYAFGMQEEIETITIPSNVKRIEDHAFHWCSSLLNIQINEGVEYIGEAALYYCLNLREIKLPKSIKEIGCLWTSKSAAFQDPTKINSLICECLEPPKIISEEWPVIQSHILYVPKGTKEKYLNAEGWSNYGDERIMEIDKLLVFLDRTSTTMTKGSSKTLNLTYTYDASNDLTIPYQVKWESSDPTVATVVQGSIGSIGNVKAVSSGLARITVTVKTTGGEEASAQCDIEVIEGSVGFDLSHNNISLNLNETTPITINLTGYKTGKSTLTVILTHENGEQTSDQCEITVLDIKTDITSVFGEETGKNINIYSINGICILKDVKPERVKTLPPGMYVVGDKKILVK